MIDRRQPLSGVAIGGDRCATLGGGRPDPRRGDGGHAVHARLHQQVDLAGEEERDGDVAFDIARYVVRLTAATAAMPAWSRNRTCPARA